jgi:hypothetical protein
MDELHPEAQNQKTRLTETFRAWKDRARDKDNGQNTSTGHRSFVFL